MRAPGHNVPLIRLLTLALYTLLVCLFDFPHFPFVFIYFSLLIYFLSAFSALTLLVGQQERHLACKN